MRAVLVIAIVAGCDSRAPTHGAPVEPPPSPPVAPPDASQWTNDAIDWPVGNLADTAPIGSATPVRWAITDPQRRWAVLCQQREDTNHDGVIGDSKTIDQFDEIGDKPSLYLVLGSGLGRKIDALYARSATGDHLVVGVEGAVALVDIATHTARQLPTASPLAVFSGDGKRLVYIAGATIVRRELATGAETQRPLPDGTPALLDLDTSGRWLVAAMARGGGRGLSHLDSSWPAASTCAFSKPHIGYDLRDAADKVWIDLDDSDVRDDQSIVRIVGGHVLAQPTIKSVTLDGKRISPSDCDRVEVFYVHEAPLSLLLGCSARGESRMELIGPHATRFAASLMPIDVPRQLGAMADTREVCPVPDYWCLDMVSGARRRVDFVWLATGLHGNEAWYDSTRTHLLVSEPTRGPLHWRRQDPGDMP